MIRLEVSDANGELGFVGGGGYSDEPGKFDLMEDFRVEYYYQRPVLAAGNLTIQAVYNSDPTGLSDPAKDIYGDKITIEMQE